MYINQSITERNQLVLDGLKDDLWEMVHAYGVQFEH